MERWMVSLESEIVHAVPEFKDPLAMMESVRRGLVVLPREAETGMGEADVRLDV